MNIQAESASEIIGTKVKVRTSVTGKQPGEFRKGKTRRDRENGAQARNISNKNERAAWQGDSKATNDFKSFPYGTCNGKRNRALKERKR